MSSEGRPRRRFFWTNVLAVAIVLAIGGLLAVAAQHRRAEQASLTRCGNNLRSIGLATIQYTSELRSSAPHVRGAKELDGDVDTDEGPRCFRSFVHWTYLDNPETFVCPGSGDSLDQAEALAPVAKADPRRFGWGGRSEAAGAPPPIARAGETDRPLAQLRDLSYGWTRRAVFANGVATEILAADRTVRDDPRGPPGIVGNHKGAIMALALSGATWKKDVRFDPGSDVVLDRGDLGVFWGVHPR